MREEKKDVEQEREQEEEGTRQRERKMEEHADYRHDCFLRVTSTMLIHLSTQMNLQTKCCKSHETFTSRWCQQLRRIKTQHLSEPLWAVFSLQSRTSWNQGRQREICRLTDRVKKIEKPLEHSCVTAKKKKHLSKLSTFKKFKRKKNERI